jgi:3-dehydroquinate dehydratase/shikimate dehydrogenase
MISMVEAALIATLMTPPSSAELDTLPGSIDWLEVRADLVGDIDPDWLRSHFKGRLLYSLRSLEEGGNFSDSPAERSLVRIKPTANQRRGIDRRTADLLTLNTQLVFNSCKFHARHCSPLSAQ